jgi:endonuclease YncB( thermonuclease family)
MRARVVAPLLALACLLFLGSPLLVPGPAPYPLPGGEREGLAGTVVRVVDGDTVHVRLADRVEKVRYIGIDAPETHHPARGEEPGGRAATEVNGRLVGHRAVGSSRTCSSAIATDGSWPMSGSRGPTAPS